MKRFLLFAMLCVSMSAIMSAEVITEQPDGEAVLYSRTGQAIFSLSQTYIGEQNDLVKVVFHADGETVYFQNILYRMDTTSSGPKAS